MRLRLLSTLFVLITAATNCSAAGLDSLALVNKKVYTGKVLKIGSCKVFFKSNKTHYYIPAKDIFFVKFADSNSKIYTDYIYDFDSNKCLKGKQDAMMYHHSNKYFIGGVLLGPIAFLLAITDKPDLNQALVNNAKDTSLINDYNYLKCYTKTARKLNSKKALMGCTVNGILIIAGIAYIVSHSADLFGL